MILISGLKLPPGADEGRLRALAAKALRIPTEAVTSLNIRKKSLDARKKTDIHSVYTVCVSVRGDEAKLCARCKQASIAADDRYRIPWVGEPELRPVIVGFGPAGMFAALVLALAGARPIVLERGPDALTRQAQIEAFRAGGAFDPECNVQFGEGGAGTFSDGKLNTGTHDKRIRWVLEQFAAHGAPEHITYDAKPHIGTDVLVNVVQALRADILAHGGEVRFRHRLTGLQCEGNRLCFATVSAPEGDYRLPVDHLILAIGHSARDTFEMLHAMGVPMTPKPFSMGVRIEHKQSDINAAQYGAAARNLPAADYALSCHLPDGESAYTFCMCPGGEVFAAASEPGGVVTNGMSRSARDGENANAALLVTLRPEDFPDPGTLGGMYWQREIEQRAFRCGGGNYHAPAQLVGDFLAHRPSAGPGSVQPTYRPGVTWCDVHDVLPARITRVLEAAIPELGKKLCGFDAPDAVLTAPETRSSSPVRIERGDDRCSTGIDGLYPCGEGAGYAGGITSAAVDGMRCAEAVLARIAPPIPDPK